MARVVLAAGFIVVAVVVALVLQRRRAAAPPRDAYPVPAQLDRADFPRPDAPWLVALFSSTRCNSCAGMADKMVVLECEAVATCDIADETRRDLHQRYAISGLPMLLIADTEGVVRRAFVGSATATDVWAAVAELRLPGSTPEPDLGREILPEERA